MKLPGPRGEGAIRVMLLAFAVICLAAIYAVSGASANAVDWDPIYPIGLGVAATATLWGAFDFSYGLMYKYLLPLQFVSLVRVVDFWQNWATDGTFTLRQYALGTVGWLLIAIACYGLIAMDYKVVSSMRVRRGHGSG